MKTINKLSYVTISILISAFVLFSACNKKAKEVETANENILQNLSVAEFESKIKDDVQVIDVRTSEEFQSEHLSKSKNIDIMSPNFDTDIQMLDKSKPVLVYCKSGGRSSEAAAKLSKLGFKAIYNLDGGIMKWLAEGKSVETGEQNTVSSGMTLADYEQLVKSDKYVIVDFNAQWCGPCKQLSPILDKIAKDHQDKVVLEKIDVDENADLSNVKKIDAIPYLEIYKNGKLVWTYKGLTDEATINKVIGL